MVQEKKLEFFCVIQLNRQRREKYSLFLIDI